MTRLRWLAPLFALAALVLFIALFLWSAHDSSCPGQWAWQCG